MPTLTMKLKQPPSVPVEAETISPDRLQGRTATEIARQKLTYGNRREDIGEFFDVTGSYDGVIRLTGDLSRIKHIGAAMHAGKIIIDGDVGQHLGATMSGGEIIVNGNADDWVGPEMSGGHIVIKGNAGHLIGSAYRGSAVGMTGGQIIIHGNVKNETGHAMRYGLIVVGGNAGDFTGVNMHSGTIIVFAAMGIRAGAGMRRGSIISMQQTELLPTFQHACLYHPGFIRSYLSYLRKMGLQSFDEAYITGLYHRWCGDSIALNRGEILLYAG